MKLSSVSPVRKGDDLDGFDCGSPAQSEWLTRHALQAHASGGCRVYVVRDMGCGKVVGYYAFAAGSVTPGEAPARLLKGAGRHAQPVVILARLGVERAEQGIGLGRALVADALRRVARVADQIGVRALLIHCESETARAFYLRLAAFEQSPSDPLHLLLLMKDLRRAAPGGAWDEDRYGPRLRGSG
ncbi:Acetyltransferase (GNAT) family protein [Microbispora rosea]|uniref:Acetyltransferase (GNAT) family protein n=1 Tax=Microbispora rosea TaxID=58117 RepID=A0A1N7CNQ6_9ACTN|nr:N-acetyltransferase GCN5 [Microbispora rosea subsp. rosea]SIR65232.1 Acetyltransferase (GNAT) family protein [Microbispora rosea]